MVTYVVVATVVAFLTGWAWYQVLFPRVAADLAGSEEQAKRMRGRNMAMMLVALVILAFATGTFIKNRGVLDMADAVKLAIKIWFGFFLPITLVSWAYTKASLTTLVATAGYWLVAALEFAILAAWLLLR